MIDVLPAINRPIVALRSLADASFERMEFNRACEQFATFDVAASDDHLWLFHVAPGWPLFVAIDESGCVSCAIFSFCWIPNTEDASADDGIHYDEVFTEELQRAGNLIGPPQMRGRDNGRGYEWAIWQGATGLFVLQQSEYDIQIGIDVHYWVQRWEGEIPTPQAPMIDWLMQLVPLGGPANTTDDQ